MTNIFSKISWKTVIGLILLAVGIVFGYIASVPAGDIVAVALIISGAVTSIYDILMKDAVKGWKCWVFVVLMTLGVATLTVAGISGSVMESVIGAIILILDIIFGAIVSRHKKE